MRLLVDKLGKVAITIEEGYWSNTKDYDKLTVVEAPGNEYKTYISRKPVPAGTVLTNRNYWIPFSSLREEIVLDYNTFVNLWTQNLNNLDIRVNQRITDEVDTLNGRITREVETLDNKIDTNVDTLNRRITIERGQVNATTTNLQNQIYSNDADIAELYNAVASVVAGGVALLQTFGNRTDFGISQKVLTDFKNDYDNLKDLVYEINYEPKFVVSPSVVFKDTPVTITATASLKFNSVSVSDFATSTPEGWEVGTTSGNTRTFTKDNVNTTQAVSTVISKGNYLKPMTANITAVDRIYYGAGATDAVLNTNVMVSYGTAITAPSFIQNITTQAGDYLYFEVPSSMRDIQKIELYDNPVFPTELSFVSVETSRSGYKAFKTVADLAAGTHTYKIS